MAPKKYPKAQWMGNGKSGGSFIDVPYRVVWHTTETTGMPGYKNGYNAPHLTYNPKYRKWYQHTDLNTAGRAMGNAPGGVQTNRNRAIQVEIICYSNKYYGLMPGRLYVGNLPATAYADMWDFALWCQTEFGVQRVSRNKNATSMGNLSAQEPGYRMTFYQWDKFRGHCGHGEVPEQTARWDPGVLDWDKFLLTAPTTPPVQPPTPKPPSGGTFTVNVTRTTLAKGAEGKEVGILQSLLAAQDYPIPGGYQSNGEPVRKFGPATDDTVRKFQKARGLVVDGYVGPKTWAELEEV